MNTVLVIDDEPKIRTLLSRLIQSEGFEVIESADAKSALKKIANHDIDVVFCDAKLPDADGVELTKKIKTDYPFTEVIVLTAFGNISDGVRATKNGAFDYITKGDDNERIIPLLYRATDKAHLQKRIRDLERHIGDKYSFHSIIGTSHAISDAITLAQKVAPNDTIVLLTGETGTGKEVFAGAIHTASKRVGKNYVALNCSTFGKDMLESELFGHRQGAFTGAVKDKKGLLEEANGGTLFLDEIGEIPLELQAKLLRVIETGEFFKLGDSKPTTVNFRLIAATNRDLKKESDDHRFRADLYYRLNVFEIHLPPLRERQKDIKPLSVYFVEYFCAKTNKPMMVMTKEYVHCLESYKWAGNIRELKNIVERSVILNDTNELTPKYLPPDLQHPVQPDTILSAFDLASVERLHIQKVLQYTNGNKTEAARLLNIGLTTLYRKIEEFNL
ncbi:MAG: sigma-54-dependent Fis family transcriptional regulator [Ignavibacteriae bacterium]|nr:sigma-54-dependent Fis family transcriptional regulator [Ignavibacteriota bacterium]